MRVFVVLFCLLVALLSLLHSSAGQASIGDQIRCLTCPGNDEAKKECCGLGFRQCCDGRVKFVGNFPKPVTTSWG